jgi:Gram-negative porin
MFGGLKKSASRLALVAAAGALATTANAADLGGDCCADLEERVAELEATTARKGNRKVSLTISGQVNRAIMYFNDGKTSNTYFGLDNTNSSSRFGFSGNAKITPTVTAGFSLLLDVADTGRTVGVSRVNEDGGTARNGGQATNSDHLVRLRDANWWLESSQIGRITVGRLTTAGGVGTPDLGGVGVVATAGEGCIGTSLNFREKATGANITSIGTASMSCAHPAFRGEGIRYNSPTFAGFSFAASVSEAASLNRDAPAYVAGSGTGPVGRNYGADLKYAGEFSGVRIAAAIGYERSELNEDDNGGSTQSGGDYRNIGLALALMHVPTGLFIQGEYQDARNKVRNAVTSEFDQGENAAKRWHIQAGISQNFFGVGKTNIYGEYGKHNGWIGLNSSLTVPGSTIETSDNMTIWGLGIVQNIDAAAMELYLGYRNYSLGGITFVAPATGAESISVIAAGARIKF